MIKLVAVPVFLLSLLFSVSANAALIAQDLSTAAHASNTSETFSFSGLGSHSQITLNFDLYVYDSWDGNHWYWGDDYFGVKVDGVELFKYTFSNFAPNTSSESNTEVATSTGNYNTVNTWGEIDRFFDDYADGFTIAHNSSTLDITFFGMGLQNLNDESWKVVDIDISSASAVPEPSVLALFALGFLGLGLSRRKSKRLFLRS